MKSRNLVDVNPYREKIKFLLDHPGLAQEVIEVPNSGIWDEDTCSNCFGTTAYILGKGAEVAISRMSGAKPPHRDIFANYGPGCINPETMETFFRRVCSPVNYQDAQEGNVVAFWNTPRTGPRLSHAGIYLGKSNGRRMFFHQTDHGENGGRFAINSVEAWEDRGNFVFASFYYYPNGKTPSRGGK